MYPHPLQVTMKRRQVLKSAGAFALAATMTGSAVGDSQTSGKPASLNADDLVIVNNSRKQETVSVVLGSDLGAAQRAEFEWKLQPFVEDEATANITRIQLTEAPSENAKVGISTNGSQAETSIPFRDSGVPDSFTTVVRISPRGEIDIRQMVK